MPSAKKFKAIDIVGQSTWNTLTDQQKIKLEVLANRGTNVGTIRANVNNFVQANAAKYAGTIKRGIEGTLQPKKKSSAPNYNVTRFTNTSNTKKPVINEDRPNVRQEGTVRSSNRNNDSKPSSNKEGIMSRWSSNLRNRYTTKKKEAENPVRQNTTVQSNKPNVPSVQNNKASVALKNTKAVSGKPVSHTIVQGETLGNIAKKYGVDWRQLAKDNGIEDPNMIIAGRKLNINGSTKTPKRNKPRRSMRTTPVNPRVLVNTATTPVIPSMNVGVSYPSVESGFRTPDEILGGF